MVVNKLCMKYHFGTIKDLLLLRNRHRRGILRRENTHKSKYYQCYLMMVNEEDRYQSHFTYIRVKAVGEIEPCVTWLGAKLFASVKESFQTGIFS